MHRRKRINRSLHNLVVPLFIAGLTCVGAGTADQSGVPGTANLVTASGSSSEQAGRDSGIMLRDSVSEEPRLMLGFQADPAVPDAAEGPRNVSVKPADESGAEFVPLEKTLRQRLEEFPAEGRIGWEEAGLEKWIRRLNLHGSLSLGIGTDDYWETRIGLQGELIPAKVFFGIEAGVGNYSGWHYRD